MRKNCTAAANGKVKRACMDSYFKTVILHIDSPLSKPSEKEEGNRFILIDASEPLPRSGR